MTDRLPLDLDGKTLELPAVGNLRRAAHVFERESLLAVNAALDCGRPLLVRGRPGVGKSQLARAAARKLGRVFLSKFIDARTEAHDLLWSYDAVTRLADAQAWGHRGVKPSTPSSSHGDESGEGESFDPSDPLAQGRYIMPGPLWWAFSWTGATAQVEHSALRDKPPTYDDQTVDPANGAVVLIDEIDKADGSVPNGLLECLGHGKFAVPGIEREVVITGPPPLVILTSNDDRVLPDAFLRRCLVLWLRVPESDDDLEDKQDKEEDPLVKWLMRRGRAHFEDALPPQTYAEAAIQLAMDRKRLSSSSRCAPGLAEYIDLLAALEADPSRTVSEMSRFFMRKHIDPGPLA